MNKSILSLIGITDTLIHLLETDRLASKSPESAAAVGRLENVRKSLLIEGVRYSRALGKGQDAIFEVATQISGHLSSLSGARDVEWLLHGLTSTGIQDVEPPPLPSSSSSQTGPKSVDVNLLKLANEFMTAVAESASKSATTTVAKPLFGGVKAGGKRKTKVNKLIYPNGKAAK